MISLVRVDDRLVHGQITVGWVPFLGADRILVVNDRLAADPVLSTILKAGGSPGVGIDVLGVHDAVQAFAGGRYGPARVIVLFESLADVQRAVADGLRFRSLNLGGLRGTPGGLRVSEAVVLSEGDRHVLHDLRLLGISVEIRLMPKDRPASLPEEML